MENDTKEKISIEVIKTLYSRFANFPINAEKNRNAPFHEAFLQAFTNSFKGKVQDIPFFISLSSWLHGLNTTLDQSFFENISYALSGGEKRDFTSTRQTLLKISKKQKAEIADIITDLKNLKKLPDVNEENQRIFIPDSNDITDANNFTADVFFEDNHSVTAIELKSVKPNAGEMRGEKQKILEAKAALYKKYPGKQVRYFIGFPFDPTSKEAEGYDKSIFLHSLIDGVKYFDHKEIKLAGELWDFLSGESNTMETILDIINKIATTEFQEKYDFICNHENCNDPTYSSLLNEWNLFSEIYILDHYQEIESEIEGNRKLSRVMKQNILKNGQYNWDRYYILKKFI